MEEVVEEERRHLRRHPSDRPRDRPNEKIAVVVVVAAAAVGTAKTKKLPVHREIDCCRHRCPCANHRSGSRRNENRRSLDGYEISRGGTSRCCSVRIETSNFGRDLDGSDLDDPSYYCCAGERG